MRERKRRKRKLRTVRAILFIILFFTISYGLFDLQKGYINSSQGNNSNKNNSQTIGSNQDSSIRKYDYVSKKTSDIGIGNLILVNNRTPYAFSNESNIVRVLSKKNKSYKISEQSIALDSNVISSINRMMSDFEKAKNVHDIIINSGYRSKNEQEGILNEKIKQLGAVEAAKWATRPGYSEHHTGYALDIGILKDGGKYQSLTDTGKYSWINENCGNYGFILRYSSEKTQITGIANEPWHYRYVGAPHANIIKNKGFCLEEYIDYLKNYSFEATHLDFTDFDNRKYEIYYVKATKDETKIPVPKNSEYTISGNNVDGFIVTVKK
jgi:zinc D-Ala-D-Ala carboxypeptidase